MLIAKKSKLREPSISEENTVGFRNRESHFEVVATSEIEITDRYSNRTTYGTGSWLDPKDCTEILVTTCVEAVQYVEPGERAFFRSHHDTYVDTETRNQSSIDYQLDRALCFASLRNLSC